MLLIARVLKGYTEQFAAAARQAGLEPLIELHDLGEIAFARDAGLRIDHHLLNAAATKRLKAAGVDRSARALPKTSDHAPLVITLS